MVPLQFALQTSRSDFGLGKWLIERAVVVNLPPSLVEICQRAVEEFQIPPRFRYVSSINDIQRAVEPCSDNVPNTDIFFVKAITASKTVSVGAKSIALGSAGASHCTTKLPASSRASNARTIAALRWLDYCCRKPYDKVQYVQNDAACR
jgi:hypothetical protein